MPNPQRQSSEELGWALHSTTLSKTRVQGICIAGCKGEILLFVPGQRKIQMPLKSVTFTWILQEAEGQEMP